MDTFEEGLTELLLRTRIVLNIHFYQARVLEMCAPGNPRNLLWLRVTRLLAFAARGILSSAVWQPWKCCKSHHMQPYEIQVQRRGHTEPRHPENMVFPCRCRIMEAVSLGALVVTDAAWTAPWMPCGPTRCSQPSRFRPFACGTIHCHVCASTVLHSITPLSFTSRHILPYVAVRMIAVIAHARAGRWPLRRALTSWRRACASSRRTSGSGARARRARPPTRAPRTTCRGCCARCGSGRAAARSSRRWSGGRSTGVDIGVIVAVAPVLYSVYPGSM